MLRRLCDRALYLREGTLKTEGPFAEVQEQYFSELQARE
jgi:ABC-type polysaccharide/polyol phosphate transport system ATPase subunit